MFNWFYLSKKIEFCVKYPVPPRLPLISDFFTKPNTVETDSVTFAEVASTFHCVKQNSSYNAQDCTNNLLPQILPDLAIAKKVIVVIGQKRKLLLKMF